jgi:hypothetical protein
MQRHVIAGNGLLQYVMMQMEGHLATSIDLNLM